MTEIVNYIFNSMKDHDRNIKFIWKNLCEQTEFNRKTRNFALALIVHMMVTKKRIQNLNDKIELLRNKIEELESREGD